jgi:CubicO group peptidase (beta-lactamase class C family)
MGGADAVNARMLEAVEKNVFPGAALLVARGQEVLHRAFYGNAALLPAPEPVTEGTLFDIASLTKPLATASLFLIAMKEKGLSLNSHAAKYLPILHTETHRKITLRHLLKHTSGLPAWKPYFETVAREHPEDVGQRKCRDYYLNLIADEPLESAVSFKKIYSDLGFILLGILLEDFWEKNLDELFEEKIAGPLGLGNTFFVPVGAGLPRPLALFAATEESAWRNKLIRGEVHDDNAYTLGGVAGHAGLFSHVDDLHRFLSAFQKNAGKDAQLGWDAPEPQNSPLPAHASRDFLAHPPPAGTRARSQAGKYFSKNSIGHLGYSGCSMWMDLEQDFHVILLTNRVHPTSKNEAIKEFRPRIHDAVYEELIK